MVWSTIYDTDDKTTDSFHTAPPRQLVAGNAQNLLDHNCELSINSAPALVRLTGIICTIGPSDMDPALLEKMMESGMNIVRLNCSYGESDVMVEVIKNTRTAAENYGKRLGVEFPVGIAVDIKGPEIRTGFIEGGPDAQVELKKGEQVKLTTDRAYYEKGNAGVIYVDYDNIQKVIQIGNRIHIDYGLISLICTNIQGSVLTCLIECGGMLGGSKGVNLPGVATDLPTISEKDKKDILLGLEHDVDMIMISYVREASAITQVRDILGPKGAKIMLIAKIENFQGMMHLDEIIKLSDGVMVGRSDLGVEIPLEKLFLAQKSIIAKCNKVGKPVICANQLLASMVKKSRPTRAECTDVANIVLDGADCLMLTAETAKGEYPIESIVTAARICKEAEAAIWYKQLFQDLIGKAMPPLEPSYAIAIAAVEASFKCLAAAIVIVTTSGRSAFLLSKCRPNCPIVAVTRNAQVARQANLYRGVLPLVYAVERTEEWSKDVELRISYAISFGKWKGFIRSGDPVIAINGSKKGSGFTDTMRILYVTRPTMEGEYVCDECH